MSECLKLSEGDEFVCIKCHLRWGRDEERPKCPKALVAEKVEAVELALAKAVIGPRKDKWLGRDKLLALRDHKWKALATKNEQNDALLSARAVLKELKAMPREELLRVLDQGNWE